MHFETTGNDYFTFSILAFMATTTVLTAIKAAAAQQTQVNALFSSYGY